MRVNWKPGDRPQHLRPLDTDGFSDSSWLNTLREKHEEAEHGVHAIEAALYCYEARIHPPEWILDWLGERLMHWIDGERESLDKAFCVESLGRGKPPALRRVHSERENYYDAYIMSILVGTIGVDVERAAEALQLRNEEHAQSSSDASWIAECWRKRWSKDSRFAKAFEFRDASDRCSFLASFPNGILADFE